MTYTGLRVVVNTRIPGRKSVSRSIESGITCGCAVRIAERISQNVNKIDAGKISVPSSSSPTTNCIEKQKIPQRFGSLTNSQRLCTVELIHRRRWDRSILKVCGTVVWQIACGTKIILRHGKCFSIRVLKNLSSPSKSRFFLCNVSTMFSEYACTKSGLTINGTIHPPCLFALILYCINRENHAEAARQASDTAKH